MTERGRSTVSGIPIDEIYGEQRAGEYPFTRGVHANMYLGRLWTMRQYAGFGTAEETNRRFRYLLAKGQTGLSVAFDLPTQMGLDSDDDRALGEVGRVGVAIDTLDDMGRLFHDIELNSVSASMTINATAAILVALYVALADERGVPRSSLAGTVQNDILKEYVARGTYIYPVEPSLRLTSDLIEFCSRELPRWNPISISGYHMREAGSTAPQEVAFTLANGIEYVDRALATGMEVDDFAPRLSFFFAAHTELLEEVAKFRAARRMWAHIMRERFGGSDRSCRLRFHTQTGGSTLTAQQPLNNVVRVTVQALAAVLGGTQSLHTNSFDEALALPTRDSARLALRTQQVIASETGVAGTVDPLGGSHFVEALTDEVERRARLHLERIHELGGAARATGYMQDEIHRASYAHQLEVEAGRRKVVGVNLHVQDSQPPSPPSPDFGVLERRQANRLSAFREDRNREQVAGCVARLTELASGTENLVPGIIDAVKAGASVGEISGALQRVWGRYRPANRV
ncbi:MAG: methylmalonyl-CoA mutase [Gemmatimonadetes bacterium]|nr:methylmalonyl-CoA mutase [Gemmatimonadota bacterium]